MRKGAVMLNQDPGRFPELGYCIYPNVLTPDETLKLRGMLDRALSSPLPLPEDPGVYLHDREDYVGEPHARTIEWLEVCRHPRVLDAVESVLGPNIVLVFSSVFAKQPHTDTVVAMHQDNNFWPSVHGTHVITVWLAVDDSDRENAALQVIPGSHRDHIELETIPGKEGEFLSKKVNLTPEQDAARVTLELKAGSLSIHDTFILHGSEANHSDRRRAGYTIRYASTDEAWVDPDEHPIPVFLMRGESGARGAAYVDLRPGVPISNASKYMVSVA